jgi:hypothetical protein
MQMSMEREYTHELNKEVQSVSGWYRLTKEQQIDVHGRKLLYVVGDAAIDSSCCGVGGCHYAVVPGYIIHWKKTSNEAGDQVSLVEPVRDDQVKEQLRQMLYRDEGVSQVQFW